MRRKVRLLSLPAAAGVGLVLWLLVQGNATPPVPPEAPGDPPPTATLPAPGEEPRAEAQLSSRRVVESAEAAPGPLLFFGTVTDHDGGPVADATLRILGPGDGEERVELARGTSDERGRFRIPASPEWTGPFRIHARAEGFQSYSRNPVRPGDEIAIELRFTSEVFGRILDASSGVPVAGASVTSGSRSVEADAAGHYRVEVAVGRQARIAVAKAGYVDKSVSVLVREPETTRLDILLDKGTLLPIRVVERASRSPIAGAVLRRYSRSEPITTTDSEGRFSLRVADGTQLSLHVSAEGYCPLTWHWEVVDPESREPTLPLIAAAWIEGRVTDANGSPVDGAGIHAENEALRFRVRMEDEERRENDLPGYVTHESVNDRSKRDQEGLFRLAVMPCETPWVVVVSHSDYVTARSGPVVAPPGSHNRVDVVLRRGATIRGRLLLNGAALRGEVTWKTADGGSGRASADQDGRYELENVAPGSVRLVVRDRFNRAERAARNVLVAAGKSYEEDFALEEERATISGRVTSPSGAPLPDIPVRASYHGPDGLRWFNATTGADGSYTVEVARNGLFEVRAFRQPVTDARKEVAPGSTGIDFVLPDVGVLRIRLVDEMTREPIRLSRFPFSAISWKPSDTDRFRSGLDPRLATDVHGIAELPLPTGKVDLNLSLTEAGYVAKTVWGLDVGEDPDREPVTIELAKGFDAKVRILGESPFDNEVRKGHLLFLLERSQLDAVRGPFPSQGGPSNWRINGINMSVRHHGLLEQMLRFDDTGVARVQSLPPGRYRIRAFPDDFVFEPAEFTLSAERPSIEVDWRRR